MPYKSPEKKKKYNKEYKRNNKDVINKLNKEYRIKLFKEIVKGYGGQCLFCGENRPEALILHHVNENGKEHRKKMGFGVIFYRWLLRNNFPNEIILLCGTCHLILHRSWKEET